MTPKRVETLPDAIYWSSQNAKDMAGILAGAYLIVQGHLVVGSVVLVLALL